MRRLKTVALIIPMSMLLTLQCIGASAQNLIPGGEAVGVTLEFDGVCITEVERDRPADTAGLKAGDCIRAVNEKKISSTEELAAQIAGASSLIVGIERNGKRMTFTVFPEAGPTGKVIGVKVMDSISGIGTVTYYDPSENSVGILGHGVSLPDKTALPEVSGGSFFYTQIVNVEKSVSGDPGELQGNTEKRTPAGQIAANTESGLFGKTQTERTSVQTVPVADGSMVHPGDAVIRCCIEGTEVREYSVQIVRVYPQPESGKELLIEVTDPVLLAQTGGIVRGMSGSPIIQDGRLVGAVTHVLVDDPTKGYGVLIETMLDTAEKAA